MDHSKFDRFIRSRIQKELDAPTELDWENMDIPIPPKDKRKRPLSIFWFGLSLLGILIIGFLILPFENESLRTGQKNESNQEIQDASKTRHSDGLAKNNEIIKNNRVPFIQTDIPSENSTSIIKNRIEPQKLKNENSAYKLDYSIDRLSDPDIKTNLIVPKNDLNTQRTEKLKPLFLLPLKLATPGSMETYKASILNLKLVNTSNKITLPEKENPWSLMLIYGLNTYQSNYIKASHANTLRDAEEYALGNSYNFKVSYQLNKKNILSAGLGFRRLHNVFYYERYLGHEDNLVERIRTHRTRKIYHNNYSDLIEVNLGLEKPIITRENLSLNFGIQVNPSLVSSLKGRILDDELNVVFIEDEATKNRWLISAGSNLDLHYRFNTNSIMIGVNYTHSFSKLKLIQNSNLSSKPQILEIRLGIGRKF